MRKTLSLICLVGVAAGSLSVADAQAKPRRYRDVAPTPAVTAPPYAGPTWLTPADRAKSGWIDGASPYNPEGSSNPQIPNNS